MSETKQDPNRTMKIVVLVWLAVFLCTSCATVLAMLLIVAFGILSFYYGS